MDNALDEVVLKKVKAYAVDHIDMREVACLKDTDVSIVRDCVVDRMLVRLWTLCVTEELERQEHRFPRDWNRRLCDYEG